MTVEGNYETFYDKSQRGLCTNCVAAYTLKKEYQCLRWLETFLRLFFCWIDLRIEKKQKQIKTRHFSTLCFKKLIHKWTWMITSTLTRLNLHKKIFQRWFVHSNILFFECFGNGNCKIEKLNLYTRNEFHLSKASAILPLIVSITKFSIVIGSP